MKSCDIYNENRFKKYKDTLFEYISEETSLSQNYDFLNKYISVLSFFIYSVDKDYNYNIPFLIEQHNNFNKFLESAKMQYKELQDIKYNIKNLEEDIMKLSEHKNIQLCLNDFLQVDMRDGLKIKFCEPFSIHSVNRNIESYVYTFCIGGRKKCFKHDNKKKMLEEIEKNKRSYY